MQILFWVIGKTHFKGIVELEADFSKRISTYIPFSVETISGFKVYKEKELLKSEEAKKILSELKPEDYLILLDEKGRSHNSREFANSIQRHLTYTTAKRLIFLVGGAFGFDQTLYNRANEMLSLSKMTYSHQLIRIIFLEQLYRAFSIIHNHPYHND